MASAGKSELIEYLTTAPNNKTEAAYETAAEAKRAVENTIEAIKAFLAKKDAEGVTVLGLGGFKILGEKLYSRLWQWWITTLRKTGRTLT